MMGGRGSSSGISDKGRKYGTEYTTLHESGNTKFVRYNDSKSAKTPMETMTKGRIYATVNNKGDLRSITFYDRNNKRYKQIDVAGRPHKIDGKNTLPHTHFGYNHDEHGTKPLTPAEAKLVDNTKKIWYRKKGKR